MNRAREVKSNRLSSRHLHLHDDLRLVWHLKLLTATNSRFEAIYDQAKFLFCALLSELFPVIHLRLLFEMAMAIILTFSLCRGRKSIERGHSPPIVLIDSPMCDVSSATRNCFTTSVCCQYCLVPPGSLNLEPGSRYKECHSLWSFVYSRPNCGLLLVLVRPLPTFVNITTSKVDNYQFSSTDYRSLIIAIRSFL
jgi:hypothetical protein